MQKAEIAGLLTPYSLGHGALGLGFGAPPHPIIMPKPLSSGRLPGLPCFPTSVCAHARTHTHTHSHTPTHTHTSLCWSSEQSI